MAKFPVLIILYRTLVCFVYSLTHISGDEKGYSILLRLGRMARRTRRWLQLLKFSANVACKFDLAGFGSPWGCLKPLSSGAAKDGNTAVSLSKSDHNPLTFSRFQPANETTVLPTVGVRFSP